MADRNIIAGPAGGGKSQYIEARRRPGDAVIDFTRLYAAVTGAQRGPDGRYPERGGDDPLLPLTAYLFTTAVRQVAARGLRAWVTTSDRRRLEELRELLPDAAVTEVDPGESVIRARLADPETGELSAQCAAAVARWYGP